MKKIYLNNALKDLNKLILLTKEDIEDIKKANHKFLDKRRKEKEHLIISFQTNKSLLNEALVKESKGKNLEDILDEKDKELLSKLKDDLRLLKQVNKELAIYVTKLNNFYTSLLEEILQVEKDGYTKARAKVANILAVSA